jgi:hypothetical protein
MLTHSAISGVREEKLIKMHQRAKVKMVKVKMARVKMARVKMGKIKRRKVQETPIRVGQSPRR